MTENTLYFLYCLSLCAYGFLGVYVLSKNPRRGDNRLFFLLCLSLDVWCLGMIMLHASQTLQQVRQWNTINSIALFSFLTFSVWFCAFRLSKKKVVLIIIPFSVPLPLLFIVLNLAGLSFFRFEKQAAGWRYWPVFDSPWMAVILAYLCVSLGVILMLLIAHRARTASRREKRQTGLLLAAFFLSLGIVSADNFLMPLIVKEYTPTGLSPVYMLLWASGIFVSIVAFRFLSFTPERISADIMEGIDEAVFFINPAGRILFMNGRAKRLLADPEGALQGSFFYALFPDAEMFRRGLVRLEMGGPDSFSARIRARRTDGAGLLLDVKCKAIRDTYADFVGTMVIGGEVRNLKRVKLFYRITDREADIIGRLITGRRNREIAADLGITDNTMKRHLRNIYLKLEVDNKIEMLSLLRRFELLPDKPADERLVSFNDRVDLLKRSPFP